MTNRNRTGRLRVDVPTLEPDPALLERLVMASASSTPARRPARPAGIRLLVAAASVAMIGATTWVAGAIPGTESPLGPAMQPTHGPSAPSPGGESGAPHPDDSTSPGSPLSPGLPGNTSGSQAASPERSGDRGDNRGDRARNRIRAPHRNNGNGHGRADDAGRGHGQDKRAGKGKQAKGPRKGKNPRATLPHVRG